MSDLLREYWKSLLGAVLVHALIAALLFLTVQFARHPQIAGQLAIEAVVVDSSQPDRSAERQRQEREAAEKVQQDKQKEQEREKAEQQREQEQQDKAKQAASRKEQEQQLAVEAEQAEIRKQADSKRQQAEQQKKLQVEQQQKADVERQQKATADKQRLAEIQRKQQEEADRRKAADDARDKTAREAELKRQLAEEEGRSSAVDSGVLAQYMALLQQRINNNWNRPLSATSGVQCDIKISQTSNGTVVSAQVTQCNGDAALKQSIEQAVYKSSPLPLPQDSRLFERNLLFRFKPD